MESFEVHEFETEGPVENELRVVLDKSGTNVMWPLGERHCRWGFQAAPSAPAGDFPAKDRQAIQFITEATSPEMKQRVLRLLQERAPWFKAGVKEFDWSARVRFQHRVVKAFGKDRVWLLGDAAHQTSPVGMQSMNIGMREAEELAGKLIQVIRQGAEPSLLATYNQSRREEWPRLVGLTGGLKAGAQTDAWVKERAGKLLSCLPGSGEDLSRLAGQIGLTLE